MARIPACHFRRENPFFRSEGRRLGLAGGEMADTGTSERPDRRGMWRSTAVAVLLAGLTPEEMVRPAGFEPATF